MEEQLLNNIYRVVNTKFRISIFYIHLARGGVFGVVNKAFNIYTNQIVAIKEMKEKIGQEGLNSTVLRQKSIPLKLIDQNIVQLIQSFIIQDRVYLVFPYIDTTLRQFMVNIYKNEVPPNVAKQIMKQLLSALKTAHCSGFMHRDVKPENILVQKSEENPEKFVIKLADWGSSRKFNYCSNQKFTEQVVPLAYRPPQLLFVTSKYLETIDIWSAGCLFAELIFGERIFKQTSQNRVLCEIIKIVGLSQLEDYQWMADQYKQLNLQETLHSLGQYNKISLDDLFIERFGKTSHQCDLLKKMLRITPQKRISAADALIHDYFKN